MQKFKNEANVLGGTFLHAGLSNPSRIMSNSTKTKNNEISHFTHKIIKKATKTCKRHRTFDSTDPKWIKKLLKIDRKSITN